MSVNVFRDEAQEPLRVEDEAQQVLAELWREKLLPFQMNVGKITKHVGYYTIHFYDSRINTATVFLTASQPFRDMVRESVLARVDQMSGPLHARGKPSE